MKKYVIAIAMATSFVSLQADTWNINHLNNVRNDRKAAFYNEVLSHLYQQADSILDLRPMSVTDKEAVPASGKKNDYMSQARYFWRNPESSDGLPYINRDGITNPEIYKLDRERLGQTADRIKRLALAYFFSGEKKYSDKAKELVDVWFLDKKTRMNPNLEYAQMIPGVNGGKGRCYGLLDAYSFIELIEALKILEKNQEWRENAISWTWPIEDAKFHKGTHDLGFMMNDSFGKAYELTGEKSYRDVVVRSAKTLSTRYSPVVKAIRSWDHNAHIWKYPVIIDNIMNLELLFEATRLTGNSTYYNIAVNHAETTLKNHFRDDHSSYHVVDYDPESGDVRMKCTHQGFSDDSFWSRGQAWGLYGFAQCYKYTGDKKFLDKSVNIADFILSLPNMPDDGIPYWDMKDPRVVRLSGGMENSDCPRDASAGAIIASGLYMLGDLLENSAESPSDEITGKVSKYRNHADKIMDNLTEFYRIPFGDKYGFILDHSTGHHPAGSEIDVPLNYADYYYMEALLRQSSL